jgi:hypothetical protein
MRSLRRSRRDAVVLVSIDGEPAVKTANERAFVLRV